MFRFIILRRELSVTAMRELNVEVAPMTHDRSTEATLPASVALLRALTAAAVLLSAVIHLEQWFAGYRDLEFIGPAFLVNAVAGLVIAVLVLAWRSWWPLLAAAAFGAATLGAFIMSATVGLFDVQQQVMDTPQVLSVVAESAAIVFAALAGWADRSDRQPTTTAAPGSSSQPRPTSDRG